jgi:hypothetical protein
MLLMTCYGTGEDQTRLRVRQARYALWFLPVLLMLLATAAPAQYGYDQTGAWGVDPGWTGYPEARACIGGRRCDNRSIEIKLSGAPVVAIRLVAHDDIGDKHQGRLRLLIDGQSVALITISRSARPHEIAVDHLRGRRLSIEAASDDEVVVEEIAVRYATGRNDPPDYGGPRVDDRPGSWGEPPPSGAAGWQSYPQGGCFGGRRCPGESLELPLDRGPVTGIRFYAHDNIGDKKKGVIRVRIDGTTIASDIDIKKRGSTHELEVPAITGQMLIFEALTGDEVAIEEVSVRYAEPRRVHSAIGWYDHHEVGGCFGGTCGRDRMEVQLLGGTVTRVRFDAHDNIGDRTKGRIRIRIDGTILAPSIDIKKAGRHHELEVPAIPGQMLVFEALTNDEVVIDEVSVYYGGGSDPSGWSGHRWQAYPAAGRCIGGRSCRENGDTITVSLEPAEVYGVRFMARDNIEGQHGYGRLRVTIDGFEIDEIDVPDAGQIFELPINGLRGSYLVLEAIADEVVVEQLEIQYE